MSGVAVSLKTLKRSRKSSKLRLSLVGDVENTMQIRSLKGLAYVIEPSMTITGRGLGYIFSWLSGGGVGLKLLILLPLPSRCWITGVHHHA